MSFVPSFRPRPLRPRPALTLTTALTLSLGLTFSACKSDTCYSSSDCADGSTCCDGTCTGIAPIPFGPADCVEGCECQSFDDAGVERSMCFDYEGTQTTQCTRVCAADADCLAADGTFGECLELGDAALLNRLCVWEAP